MVDACTACGILPFYGPFGDIKDVEGCEAQFRAAFLMGCVGAWSLHPVQIDIAKKVFSPDPDEVAFAKKVIEAIPDGRGVHMIDGKMQDDATWKQCRVMVDLAEMLAAKDPELRSRLRDVRRTATALRGKGHKSAQRGGFRGIPWFAWSHGRPLRPSAQTPQSTVRKASVADAFRTVDSGSARTGRKPATWRSWPRRPGRAESSPPPILRTCGFSEPAIAAAVRRGLLTRWGRGVYLVGPLTDDLTEARAALDGGAVRHPRVRRGRRSSRSSGRSRRRRWT